MTVRGETYTGVDDTYKRGNFVTFHKKRRYWVTLYIFLIFVLKRYKVSSFIRGIKTQYDLDY